MRLAGIAAFLATGLYMDRVHGHLRGYDDAVRMLYRSSHICLLLAAVTKTVLGLYLRPADFPWRSRNSDSSQGSSSLLESRGLQQTTAEKKSCEPGTLVPKVRVSSRFHSPDSRRGLQGRSAAEGGISVSFPFRSGNQASRLSTFCVVDWPWSLFRARRVGAWSRVLLGRVPHQRDSCALSLGKAPGAIVGKDMSPAPALASQRWTSQADHTGRGGEVKVRRDMPLLRRLTRAPTRAHQTGHDSRGNRPARRSSDRRPRSKPSVGRVALGRLGRSTPAGLARFDRDTAAVPAPNTQNSFGRAGLVGDQRDMPSPAATGSAPPRAAGSPAGFLSVSSGKVTLRTSPQRRPVAYGRLFCSRRQ